MIKRFKILLSAAASVAVVLVLAFVALQTYLDRQYTVNLTDDQVRQMIDKELPRGTARSAVRKFLASKGWPPGDEGAATFAMIPDAEHSFLIRKDIQFHFDLNDKLTSYELKDFFLRGLEPSS